jgi:hypothetical protein
MQGVQWGSRSSHRTFKCTIGDNRAPAINAHRFGLGISRFDFFKIGRCVKRKDFVISLLFSPKKAQFSI